MNIDNINSIFVKVSKTLEAKNHDYGNAFENRWERRGIIYAADKIFEKASRIDSLSDKENAVKGESLTDALLDIIGYAALTLDKMTSCPCNPGAQFESEHKQYGEF